MYVYRFCRVYVFIYIYIFIYMYIHIYICVCLSSKCWCAARPPTCSATALICKDLCYTYISAQGWRNRTRNARNSSEPVFLVLPQYKNHGFRDFTDFTGTDRYVYIDYIYKLSKICTTRNQHCLVLLLIFLFCSDNNKQF